MRTAISIAAALLAALPSAALADELYRCDHGTALRFVDATNEAIIQGGADGFDVVLPWAGSAGRFATWSPRGLEAVGEREAPFVEFWQPAHGPAQIVYALAPGKEIACAPPG